MHQGKIIGLAAVLILAACQPAPTSGRGLPNSDSTVAVSDVPQQSEMQAMDDNAFALAATKATNDSGELVIVKSFGPATTPLAIVIRYLAGDTQTQPATCTVQIVEKSKGEAIVVAANDSLLDCALASDAQAVGERIAINVDGTKVGLVDDADKKNASFELERHADGAWFVTKASFTYPENDLDTGEIVVVNEVATYPLISRHTLVSDYSYEAIKGDFVRSTVE